MKLEEEISQTQFNSEYHKLMVNLIFTHNWFSHRLKSFLKPYSITPQQYNVLRILRGQHPKPISTCTIRTRMLDRMSDASRIVDRLTLKGFVQKQTCASDKRLVDVMITEKGLNTLSKIDEHTALLEVPSNHLSEEEAKQMNDFFDKMRG